MLNNLFSSFKKVPSKQKEFGSSINSLKNLVIEKIESYKNSFEYEETGNEIDLASLFH